MLALPWVLRDLSQTNSERVPSERCTQWILISFRTKEYLPVDLRCVQMVLQATPGLLTLE